MLGVDVTATGDPAGVGEATLVALAEVSFLEQPVGRRKVNATATAADRNKISVFISVLVARRVQDAERITPPVVVIVVTVIGLAHNIRLPSDGDLSRTLQI
jgi:hypothetical protein